MALYIIFRHGSNGANQSLCQAAVVGSVEAKNRREALDKFTAENPTVTVYSNQFLEAFPYSRAKKWQREAAEESNLYNQEEGAYFSSLVQ